MMTIAAAPPPAKQSESETDVAGGDRLPITTASTTSKVAQKLKLIPFICLVYFEVAGGPYGEEPVIKASGVLLGLLGFCIFPFIWSGPEALITAELATAYPGNGGFVIWAERAFGPFCGSLMGTWKFLSGVINIASFPVLAIGYLERLFPVFGETTPRYISITLFSLFLSFLNFTGLTIVGWVAVALGAVSLSPFVVLSGMAIPKIKPQRWLTLSKIRDAKGHRKYDWSLYFNTLFWNLNFWDNVSTMAGEVERPSRTFPLGLSWAVLITCLSYVIPLFCVTGAVDVDQNDWDTGFMATAAAMIGGNWLKIWIEIGAVLSAVGLYEAQLSSSAYQVEGMAEIGFLPKFCGRRSKWFNTPWIGILLSTAISLGMSFLTFDAIISTANFLYSLGMLLEFASFLWLRRKFPAKKRPYRVPMKIPGLSAMLMVPSAFLVYIMCIGTKSVYLMCGLMTAGGIGWYFLMKYCKKKNWLSFTDGYKEDD